MKARLSNDEDDLGELTESKIELTLCGPKSPLEPEAVSSTDGSEKRS